MSAPPLYRASLVHGSHPVPTPLAPDVVARCCIRASSRLVDALQALEQGAIAITLILDDDDRLVGIMTDGDVRRALLREPDLTAPIAPHVRRDFISVGPRANRVEVLELMQARMIDHVPVVDADRRFAGLHLLHDVIRRADAPNWAVIMAGGRGTRLRPYTDNIPKPMLPVAGRPILERLVLHLVGFGIRRIFIAVNYLGEMIEAHFSDGARFGCRIEYLREDRTLGTGGALSLLPETPEHPIIVLNGDLVTQVDFGRMLAFHESGGQLATMAVRRYVHTVPFGCVDVVGDKIVGIEEKPDLTRLINAGIYVLSPAALELIPRGEEFAMPSLFAELIRRGDTSRVHEIEEDWIDVGRRDQLAVARGDGGGAGE